MHNFNKRIKSFYFILAFTCFLHIFPIQRNVIYACISAIFTLLDLHHFRGFALIKLIIMYLETR